ncbi:MAG: hypothetical protein UT34_C0001G0183 [candidate division WS6 bacterium GW2011_GWF2_39_15]|uniref:Cupin type-2 domain-containing protein n=1 Tax=candidate division WS6 bacterium GW2011_GWF2_39_15 TaxID=1619100 RepID=A0A0G0MSM8_9BACT|nr:MAG: hypothetical protein UT34_C0001G0183 [candidate division WS6 bacterium GW2011_GWF2_39_15]
MNIIKNKELGEFFRHSFKLMQSFEHGRRYYHTLTKEDNSPVVIRKNTDQITYVAEGSGTVYLDGKEQKIKAGETILIVSGTTIRFVASSEKLTLFHIHIPDTGRENDRQILEGKDFNYYKVK